MEVKVTGHSHNLKSTIKYICPTGNRAHQNSNSVTKRNKYLLGLNGVRTNSRRTIYHDMSKWNLKKPKNKVKSTQIVLSFSHNELNFENNPEDVSRGLNIAKDFSNHAFPNHATLLAPQNDNKNEISHIHIIVDQINQKNLKSLKGSQYNIYKLRQIARQSLRRYNHSPVYKGEKIKGLTHRQNNSITPAEKDVINRLKNVFTNTSITSRSKFRHICRIHNVRASFRRHKLYLTETDSNGHKHYIKDKNGHRKYNRIYGIAYKPLYQNHSVKYIRGSNISRFDEKLNYINVNNFIYRNKHLTKIKRIHNKITKINRLHKNKIKRMQRNRDKSPSPLQNSVPHNTYSQRDYTNKDSDSEDDKIHANNINRLNARLNNIRLRQTLQRKQEQYSREKSELNNVHKRKYNLSQRIRIKFHHQIKRQIKQSKSNLKKTVGSMYHNNFVIQTVAWARQALKYAWNSSTLGRKLSKAHAYASNAFENVLHTIIPTHREASSIRQKTATPKKSKRPSLTARQIFNIRRLRRIRRQNQDDGPDL